MRAAVFRRFGPPDVLEVVEVPRPVPARGEVLVRVEATSVNGGELAQRQGRLRRIARTRFPSFPGIDFAGEIVALGAGITDVTLGDRVWGTVDERGPVGSAAEYLVVESWRVAGTPQHLTSIEAVTLLAGGATALVGLRDKVRLRAGERLLVRGAAGGVGSIAVQVGVMLGARVTALAHPASADFVRALGADEVIDYREPIEDLGRYDVIFDTRGTSLWRLRTRLAPGGRMVTIAFDLDRPWRSLGAIAVSGLLGPRRIRFFLGHPTGALFEDLRKIAEARHLRPVVDSVYPLEQIAEAHGALESGGVHGKVVVSIRSSSAA
ncbi:NAD(P)-dependent alcohol dehydrogenase [Xylanimonas oleitrophica]|uniref:NAD(P)-dependent alcohol dehydrogenase n=2 Tax=Xylanimonas oleitrophica TaxID=2607479 RepID=A0A2W5WL05_9MICO|nr:NAD(P)-dependent alcohol dehydrogenase [Xylanimonas oleitrophica]